MRFSLINIGVKKSMTKQLVRQVRLTNILILFLFIFAVLILFTIIYENGWIVSAYLDLFSILVLAILLWFNYLGYLNLSRLILSIYPIFITITASILVKLDYPESVVVYDFFDARVLIVGFFMLPFLFFSYKTEKTLMLSAFIFLFFVVIAFDPIHNLFGVGFEKYFGVMPKAYIVSGIYIDFVLFFAVGSMYYFKFNIESLLEDNDLLADDLGEKNMELSTLFEELENANEVLKRDEVIIGNQKKLLENANLELTKQVEIKTSELRQANEELIKQNNELHQFSNTLSHNLRAPVANLLGLAQLYEMDKSEVNREKVVGHIHKSAESLDVVIKDLNKVVELRNNLLQIKEKIIIKEEIDNIWQMLGSSTKHCNAQIILDIKAPVIYGVRSYFHSILYNLISNSIKYRNTNKDCLIEVKTTIAENDCVIEFQDNGIGIDLKKYSAQLFGMYKRFHDHLEGKGLGLFLTKQQVEAMKGSIQIQSEINVGTKFTLKFPNVPLSKIKSQLFYSSDIADIYLDTANSISTILWKILPTPSEFREVSLNNVEIFNAYHSNMWIVDFSLIIKMNSLEKKWIIEEAIDKYISVGIQKIAVIQSKNKDDGEFWDKLYLVAKSKSLDLFIASSTKEAKEKLLNL